MFDIFKRKKKPVEEPKAEVKEEPKVETPKEPESKPAEVKSLEELESIEKNKKVIDILKTVQDPELGLDVWTLGLIYNINIDDNLHITMTFTTPMCPYGPEILSNLKSKLTTIGYTEPDIDLVFNPPWKPSDEVREVLGV